MEFSDYYKKFHSTYILNYLKDWVYNYKIINQKSNNYFTSVKIILKKENKIRFGLHVKQSRINLMENNSTLYPVSLIIVKYNAEYNNYKLINSVYDITDNIFSTYYKSFEPGEYHIFMYYNADKSEVSDYNYTLSTYSKEKVELLDFEDNNEIPYNYLFQVVHDYISQNDKIYENINDDINYYFDNYDNNLGLYFLSINNKSKLYYFIELDIDNINCEFINDELVLNYIFSKEIFSNRFNINKYRKDLKKLKKIKQIIKYMLKPGENKIFIWKLKCNVKNCSLKLNNKKINIYNKKTMSDLNHSYLENLYKYEMIHNIFPDLEKKSLNEDLQYSETQNNEYIFLIIKNINKRKSYIIELSFIKLDGLKFELSKIDKNYDKTYNIIFYPGKIQILSLKKDKTSNLKYNFSINYYILPL
jgi:hypothetical protein